MKRRAALALVFGLALSGCRNQTQPMPSSDSREESTADQAATRAMLLQLGGRVFSKGPNGETPTDARNVSLSDEEVARIRRLHATAAIVLHYAGNDWSNAQVAGLRSEFNMLGIQVIAVTDAGFKPEKQVSDLETVLAMRPNIIVSIPADPAATAGAYRKAAASGAKLIFMDNVPKGLVAGKDYVSVVSADNYGNGVAAALLMAQALAGRGDIGIIYHAADFFVTRERYDAFRTTIADYYPGIHIMAQQGIGGPDFSGDAERAASAMITSHARLRGIWAVWDVPAEGVIAAARTTGRTNLVVTTCDLGENVAIDMARGGFIKGVGAQRPYDQGTIEAMLAGYALLNKTAPIYVAMPAVPVTRSNLLDAWQTVYHKDAPEDVQSSLHSGPGLG